MAMFNQTNNMDPIEIFKWFQERKANASLPKSQQSNALGSKPGDVGTGELSPVEDYFASMWEKTQEAIESARKQLIPTMEQKAQQSAEEAAALRSKRGLNTSVASLGSVITRDITKDKMQETIDSVVQDIAIKRDKPEKQDEPLSFGRGLMSRKEDVPADLPLGKDTIDLPKVEELAMGSVEKVRSVRNNNPGNLNRNRTRWEGMSADQASDPRFVVFETPEYGVRAMGKTLQTHQKKHNLNTISGIISRWAPPKENDTQAYIQIVSSKLGIGPNTKIDIVKNKDILSQLTSAMIEMEGGKEALEYFTPEVIKAGIDML